MGRSRGESTGVRTDLRDIITGRWELALSATGFCAGALVRQGHGHGNGDSIGVQREPVRVTQNRTSVRATPR